MPMNRPTKKGVIGWVTDLDNRGRTGVATMEKGNEEYVWNVGNLLGVLLSTPIPCN